VPTTRSHHPNAAGGTPRFFPAVAMVAIPIDGENVRVRCCCRTTRIMENDERLLQRARARVFMLP
jgi:hypothetical protein